MIVFFRLTERMIGHYSFSVSEGNQGGLNAIWLPHCHRPVKNNKAIIWTNIRTTVTLKARKWEKRKNLKASVASTLRDFDKLSWTIMYRLIANMIVNDSWNYHRLSSTIMTVWTGLYTTVLHTPWSSMTFVFRWRWSIWCTVVCWFHICWSFSKEYSVDNECYTIHIRNQVNALEELPTFTRERGRLV